MSGRAPSTSTSVNNIALHTGASEKLKMFQRQSSSFQTQTFNRPQMCLFGLSEDLCEMHALTASKTAHIRTSVDVFERKFYKKVILAVLHISNIFLFYNQPVVDFKGCLVLWFSYIQHIHTDFCCDDKWCGINAFNIRVSPLWESSSIIVNEIIINPMIHMFLNITHTQWEANESLVKIWNAQPALNKYVQSSLWC